MAKATFINSSQDITVDECVYFYNLGMSIIFDEGRHVTFEKEE